MTDKHTDRRTDGQTDRQTIWSIVYRNKGHYIGIILKMSIFSNVMTDGQTDRQTDRQTIWSFYCIEI